MTTARWCIPLTFHTVTQLLLTDRNLGHHLTLLLIAERKKDILGLSHFIDRSDQDDSNHIQRDTSQAIRDFSWSLEDCVEPAAQQDDISAQTDIISCIFHYNQTTQSAVRTCRTVSRSLCHKYSHQEALYQLTLTRPEIDWIFNTKLTVCLLWV